LEFEKKPWSRHRPVQRLSDDIDVHNLFRPVLRIFVEVDKGEVAVVDGRKLVRPRRDVPAEEQLIRKRHRMGTEKVTFLLKALEAWCSGHTWL
jgi:hypothetical protein